VSEKNRISRVITRSGDEGQTGLADGSRRAKTDARIEALGAVDELNACLGLIEANLHADHPHHKLLWQRMHELFDLGAELSQPGVAKLDSKLLQTLEQQAQALNDELPPLREFILPGGSEAVARCHLARTVCRRCERNLWQLNAAEKLNPVSLQYLNRLSDFLFIFGRVIARQQGQTENYWQASR